MNHRTQLEPRRLRHISKFLSLVLRHSPERIGLRLDAQGWADVEELLEKSPLRGPRFSLEDLRQVVRDNDKQRFTFDATGERIRANQGHSIDVELALEPLEPPDVLFHGTVEKFLRSIREQGLQRGDRHHVHLSADEETALRVGGRRGVPVLLEVDAKAMSAAGIPFYCSKNGVWLTDEVAPQFLSELDKPE